MFYFRFSPLESPYRVSTYLFYFKHHGSTLTVRLCTGILLLWLKSIVSHIKHLRVISFCHRLLYPLYFTTIIAYYASPSWSVHRRSLVHSALHYELRRQYATSLKGRRPSGTFSRSSPRGESLRNICSPARVFTHL